MNNHKIISHIPKPIVLLLCALLLALPAAAAPDLSLKTDTAPLYAPDNGYRFRTLPFISADGKRHYRVFVGIPESPPPAAGYPVLYALDGNALTGLLSRDLLRSLNRPPVLVLIGYDTDLRLNPAARSYDYTPPLPDGSPVPDLLHPERRNGGAEAFLTLLQQEIRPQVARLAPLNTQQQALWGHSYGGLFVLYTLMREPQAFDRYIAADPALWFQHGSFLRRFETWFRQPQALQGRHIRIDQSGSPSAKTALTEAARQKTAKRQQAAAAANANPCKLAEELDALEAVSARYRRYPDLNHGALLGASFTDTLKAFGQASPNPPHLPPSPSCAKMQKIIIPMSKG
ncbi:alpha/beta hydrolase [Bergeriella denitrificans]|uniref:Esterase n=1 Tax=Bergeriella denitrificans TaxID=494 RepID=A0A378UE59_BERDE|nr:alpha/beta hydrolase-fold protein [Bergeriella denitrificans]STZ75595.1 esterase [Bergeriella denitrificans]